MQASCLFAPLSRIVSTLVHGAGAGLLSCRDHTKLERVHCRGVPKLKNSLAFCSDRGSSTSAHPPANCKFAAEPDTRRRWSTYPPLAGRRRPLLTGIRAAVLHLHRSNFFCHHQEHRHASERSATCREVTALGPLVAAEATQILPTPRPARKLRCKCKDRRRLRWLLP